VVAARHSCSHLIEVLRLILYRKLSVVWKVPDSAGIMALAVLPDEVRGHLCEERTEGIAPTWAQHRLETTHRVMQAFLKLGIFTAETIVNPVHGGQSKIIPTAQVEAFERAYVSLFMLARDQGRHIHKVALDLKTRGIQPAWDPE